MSTPTPRLRMFAGPNGSGKTTIKNGLPSVLFGVYVNPDDLEKALRDEGVLHLGSGQELLPDLGGTGVPQIGK
jgi:predicted kinase